MERWWRLGRTSAPLASARLRSDDAAAGVALCMASTNVGVQEMPRAPGSYATDLFPQQIDWADGYARCSDVPGLGVELNEALAEERRVPLNSWVPRVHRRDGAFSNW